MESTFQQFEFAIRKQKEMEAARDKVLTKDELEQARLFSKKCEEHYLNVKKQIIQ